MLSHEIRSRPGKISLLRRALAAITHRNYPRLIFYRRPQTSVTFRSRFLLMKGKNESAPGSIQQLRLGGMPHTSHE